MLLAALVGAMGLVVVAAAPSQACSCAFSTAKEYVGFADVVVTGTIDHREPPFGSEDWTSTDPATWSAPRPSRTWR